MLENRRAVAAYLAQKFDLPQKKMLLEATTPEDILSVEQEISAGGALSWQTVFGAFSLQDNPAYAEFDEWFLWDDGAFWTHFAEIKQLVQDDLREVARLLPRRVGTDFVSPLSVALKNNALEPFLEGDFWEDNIKAFRQFWFSLDRENTGSPLDRKKFGGALKFREISEIIYTKMGQTSPYEVAQKIGYSDFEQVLQDMASGNAEKIFEAYEAVSEPLTMDLLLGPYSATGEIAFSLKTQWEQCAADVFQGLVDRGVVFTADELSFACRNEYSIAMRALDFGQLSTLFAPSLWVGNLEEMVKLHETIEDKKKKHVGGLTPFGPMTSDEEFDFSRSFYQAALATASCEFDPNQIQTKADLLEGQLVQVGDHAVTIKPIFMPIVWQNLKEISDRLHQKDQPLTLQELSVLQDDLGQGMLQRVAQEGAFGSVARVFVPQKQYVTAELLDRSDMAGKTVLNALRDGQALPTLLCPQQWVQRSDDFAQVVNLLSPEDKVAMKLDVFYARLNALHLWHLSGKHVASQAVTHEQRDDTRARQKQRGPHVRPS